MLFWTPDIYDKGLCFLEPLKTSILYRLILCLCWNIQIKAGWTWMTSFLCPKVHLVDKILALDHRSFTALTVTHAVKFYSSPQLSVIKRPIETYRKTVVMVFNSKTNKFVAIIYFFFQRQRLTVWKVCFFL